MKIRNSNFEFRMGFTLLEVIVGMAIVGLGVMTLLEVFSSGLRLGAKSAERTEAVGIGRQVMDEVLTRRMVADGREEGSSAGVYRWSLQISSFRDVSAPSLSSGWELKEIALQMGSSVRIRTLRLVNRANNEGIER